MYCAAYLKIIDQTQSSYIAEAKALMKQGNKQKAAIMMSKKKLVEKEVHNYILYLQILLF